ncbi:hypothetical protein NE237_000205 [Protea cynaroides]|uniref:Uncharacterized protein n=1 Tax=Protea cynaroides TaxID=273540 RepID=A0A9Q0KRR1_9MAGN|nr:hypothetical protein NE237_000205 [Protea cynaroides]
MAMPLPKDIDLEQKEISVFFDLVDRAHSLQLLNEKNQGSQKPLKNNFTVWQPSFQPEDFNLPSKRASISTVNPSCRTMATVDDEGKEENRLKRALKRPRQFVDLAPLLVSEEGLKKGDSDGKVLLYDLNKEAEPSEGVNGGFG